MTKGKNIFPFSSPAIFLQVLYIASIANSIKFCIPEGIIFILLVALIETTNNITIVNNDISKVFVMALFKKSIKKLSFDHSKTYNVSEGMEI